MSHISKHDLAVFFGSSESQGAKASSVEVKVNAGSRDLLRDSYAKCNRSLIMKIHQLEVKIRDNIKTIDELREENALLKKKLYDRENLENSDILDALVEERIKRKLHKLGNISTRTIDYLHKAALSLRKTFEDFGLELAPEAQTRSHEDVEASMKASQVYESGGALHDVCESPPLVSKLKKVQNCCNGETPREIRPSNEALGGEQYAWSDTQLKCFRNLVDRKGDDEMMLQPSAGASCSDDNGVSTRSPSVLSRRQVVETTRISWAESDTARRKRAAALKIKNMAEPRLNNKLRRPGRYDEPHQFISSTY